jgi:diphthine-ammonia ligase
MQKVDLDARIVKVASGGLDESFLWGNVASELVIRRIERSMKRFGTYGDGAVLGEGGEFETLVIDGPASLFKGRIEIQENDMKTVREGGGSSWLRILNAKVVMKNSIENATACRTPNLLDPRFSKIFDDLTSEPKIVVMPKLDKLKAPLSQKNGKQVPKLSCISAGHATIAYWTITANGMIPNLPVTEEAGKVIKEIRQRLHQSSLQPTNIISTIIILRSMQDFAPVNKVIPTSLTHSVTPFL